MNRMMKVFRYKITDTAKAAGVYYIIVAALVVLGLLLPHFFPQSNVEFGGFRMGTTIFLLVAGLNSFKSSFLFLQANGVTRRQFYAGGAMALAAVALAMTAVDAALYAALNLIVPVVQMPIQYAVNGYAAGLLWTLALNVLTAFAGWFITMLYYRSDKVLKLVISIFPAILFIILPLLDSTTGVWSALVNAFQFAMGLAGRPNAYIASLSMLVAAAVFLALSFLLIRRAPVKEQDK